MCGQNILMKSIDDETILHIADHLPDGSECHKTLVRDSTDKVARFSIDVELNKYNCKK